ncbi:MAG: A/G-specific adenine glycosylase [Thermomicrobiales bacterium]|nr:A/G-specific adenine glycosylase [Thermomicrobiales bacterium]
MSECSRSLVTSALPSVVDPTEIAKVRSALLSWFAANRRDLPWRHSRDPYRILVSEVMLQQTQVDRVLPYYEAFLHRFPDVQALAAAPTAEVIKAWAGLGYNRRAVNLQRTAQYVAEHLGGEFPSDVGALRQLPGIGPYTAGAIACFAFEQDVAFVDTNIRRVLHRVFVGVDVPTPSASEREIVAIAGSAVPAGDGWTWNQALMEFGALQCTARKPACVICPLQSTCRAFPVVLSALGELPRGVRLKREAPFTGSNRFYRGRVLAALRDEIADGIALTELGPRVRDDFKPDDLPWLYDVVQGLERDGLALVAEDSPPYDAEPEHRPVGSQRVRLP